MVLLFAINVKSSARDCLQSISWDSNTIADQTYWIGESTTLVIPPYQLNVTTSATNNCGESVTYFYTTVDIARFTFSSSTGQLTVSITDHSLASNSPIKITLTAQASTTYQTVETSTNLTFNVTIDSHCRTTTLNSGIINQMTVSALKIYDSTNTNENQTINDFQDTASSLYSINCGTRTTTLSVFTSLGNIIANQNCLTYDSTSKTLKLISDQLSQIGNYTATLTQCLTIFSTICNSTNFSVSITACKVTSITASNNATYTGVTTQYFIDSSAYTLSFPTYVQSPSCNYSPNYSGKVGTTSFPSTGISQSTSTLTLQTSDRTIAGTYVVTFIVTLNSCLGVCSDQSITTNVKWVDLCYNTTIIASTISAMSTSELATPAVVQTFSGFQDSVSIQKNSVDGMLYCGARTCTVNQPSLLSLFGTTISLKSNSNLDFGTYLGTVTCSLSSYSTVTSAISTFTVTVNDCILETLTTSGSIASKTYILGNTKQVITIPSFTQSPLCGYSISYLVSYNGGSYATVSSIVNAAATIGSLEIYSVDRSLADNVAKPVIVSATASTITNTAIQFYLTISNPCLTTQLIAPTYTNQVLSLFTIGTTTLTTKDIASNTYGLKDGVSLCGTRTYTVQYTFNGVSVTPDFIVQSSDTLTASPVSSTAQGVYTITVICCLDEISGIACTTTSFTITINPCKITSTTSSKQMTTRSSNTFDATWSEVFPTYIQVSNCGYTPTFTVLQTNGNAIPSFMSYTQPDNGNTFTYYSDDLTQAGTYNLKLVLTFQDLPTLYSYSDSSVTWTITIVNACTLANLNFGSQSLSAMTTSVLFGTAVTQGFTEPYDSLSLVKDTTQTYYTLSAPFTWTGPTNGNNLCGERAFSVSSTCSSFLTFDTTIAGQPLISVTSTQESNVGTHSCIITAKLKDYSAVAGVTKTVSVTILTCQVLSLSMSASPSVIQEYVLNGPSLQINFPTVTQTPACGKQLTWTKSIIQSSLATYPSGTQYTDADPVDASISNLNNILTFDTTNKKLIFDIKKYFPNLTSLTSYQYQGDYGIVVTATTISNTPTMIVSDFNFIIRVINPCKYSSFTTNANYAYNRLNQQTTLTSISTTVLVSQTGTFSEWTDDGSINYSSADDYTFCGARTYTYSPTYTWLSLNTLTKEFTVSPTLSSQVGYADKNGCYVITLTATLTLYSVITNSQNIEICIEECKPTSFSLNSALTAKSYTIYDSQLEILTNPYTQTPACGYSFVYTATLEKTQQTQTISDSVFSAQSFSSTIFSYITFENSTPKFIVYSTSTKDSGVYQVKMTATLQETKYNQAINTNTDQQFQLTMVDPCASTLLNSFTDTSKIRTINDMVTTVKAASPATQTFYQFMDRFSYSKDDQSASINSISIGVSICGPRTYTIAGDYVDSITTPWLQFDDVQGILTASTDSDSYINFSKTGSRYGHKVTIVACLTNYLSICSSVQTFYVKIGECQVTSINHIAQSSFSHYIFAPNKTQDLVTYTQVPACGWSQSYSGLVNGTSLPSWISIVSGTTVYWTVFTSDFTLVSSNTVTQIVTLDDKIDGVSQNTVKTLDFTFTWVDPCTTTVIESQNNIDEAFDSSLLTAQSLSWTDSSKTKQMQTSVLVGTDINGAAWVNKTFNLHKDTTSNTYQVTDIPFVCGDRTYTIQVYNGVTYVTKTFLDLYKLDNFTMSIGLYSGDDIDINIWQVKLTVSLARYPQIATITEYFYVQIESCIINAIKYTSLSGSDYDLFVNSTNPLTPFEYNIFSQQVKQTQVATNFYLMPNCSYTILYKVNIIDTATIQASQTNVGMLASPIPTLIQFQSSNKLLDRCIYNTEIADPITNIIDYSACIQINPYKLNFVAYISPGTFNAKSVQSANTELAFYVWPKDPCYSAKLLPQVINKNEDYYYFLYDDYHFISVNNTQDSISLNTEFKISPYEGIELCGKRNYKVVQGQTDDDSGIAKVDLAALPPEISIFTENPGYVGINTMRLKTWLKDYSNITGYSYLNVIVYQIVPSPKISIKYYQITSPQQVYKIKEFTINPTNPLFTLEYTLQVRDVESEKIINPTPQWITFNNATLQIKVVTKFKSHVGSYYVDVIAQAYNIDTQLYYATTEKMTFIQIITEEIPPVSVTKPPYFVKPLEDQVILYGEASSYKLPNYIDDGSYDVNLQIQSKPNWMQWDSQSSTFTVLQDITTKQQIGAYIIRIKLTNSAGAIGLYSFIFNVIQATIKSEQTKTVISVDLAPKPTIQSITEKGLVTINWDKSIKVPRNKTWVRELNYTYTNFELGIQQIVPALDLQIIVGKYSQKSDLKFNWAYSQWTSKQIQIQLYFDTPLLVSHNDILEKLQIIFYDTSQWVSKSTGARVLGGPIPNNMLIGVIPPQKQLKDDDLTGKVKAQSSLGSDIGQAIFQICLSYFLNSLWSMICTQQIIVLIPLFKINLPDNAGSFFNFLMKIAAFDIIPTDTIFNWMFQTEPPDALTENFDTVGFSTTYFLYNLGSLTFALYAFPFQVVISQILKRMYRFRTFMRWGLMMEKTIYWNQTIAILKGSYTILLVCAAIQQTAFEWDNGFGALFFSANAVFYFVVCLLFPFFQFAFCWKYFDRLSEPGFKKRFGSMWDSMRITDKGFMFYNFWFIARRMMLALLVVYSRNCLYYQIAGLIFQVQIAMIVQGSSNSFEETRANKMEYFNEIMILACMYNVMCFTDFQPDEDIQFEQGYFICFCVLFHIGVNLLFLASDQAQILKTKWLKYRMMRKFAKIRGQQNRKIQKQKRHEKWKQTTARILGREMRKKKGGKLEPIKEESNEQSYIQAQEHESNQSISSVELSIQSLNYKNPVEQTIKLYKNRPVDSGEAPYKKIAQFMDGVGNFDNTIHKKLGHQQKADFREKDVHNKLGKGVPLDVLFADPLDVMNEDMPDEWQQTGLSIKDRLGRRAPKDQEIKIPDKNEMIFINNKLSRMTNQDFKFTKSKVKPVEKKRKRLRVQADAKAIHERLFVKLEPGDGQKFNSEKQIIKAKENSLTPSKRKPIVEEYKKIVVPKMRDEMTVEDIDDEKNKANDGSLLKRPEQAKDDLNQDEWDF